MGAIHRVCNGPRSVPEHPVCKRQSACGRTTAVHERGYASKRGAQREAEGIQFMMRQNIASYSMTNLSPAVIAGYRDDRLKTVSAGTIIEN